MSQRLPANNFELIKGTSRFNEDFMKNYNEDSDEWYSLEIEVQYLEKLHELQNNLPFLHEQSDEGYFLVVEVHNNIYQDIEEDVETRFDTSNFELDGLLPKEKITK